MKKLIIFFLFFASAVRAESSPLIPLSLSSKADFSPRSKISKDAALEDLHALENAFREGYGGWGLLANQFEGTVFSDLNDLNQNFIGSRELCGRIGKALDRLPDHHLSVFYLGGPGSCGKTPERKGSVGPNVMPVDDRPWGHFERKINGRVIPILALTHLPGPSHPKWGGFLDKVRLIFNTAPALIIDLRGNGGGNDTMTKQMASILYGIDPPSEFPYPESEIIRRQTPDALAILANNFGLQILLDHMNGRVPSPDLISMQSYEVSEYVKAIDGQLPSEMIIHHQPMLTDSKKAFPGPIRILVDAECGSSCETTVEAFENHPQAKTVGEDTAGYVHFGSMGYWWMQNSNLFVSIPTQRRIFADGRSVEKVGYAPRIPTPSGADALDTALRSISEALK